MHKVPEKERAQLYSGGSLKPRRLQQLYNDDVPSKRHYTEITAINCCRTQYMKTPENSWGVKLPNGTWDGVTGVMARREADVSNTALVATSARMSAVDFLMPITQLK